MKYLFISLLSLCHFASCTDQSAADEQTIKRYLSDNNLTAERTDQGIYYIIDVPGNSEYPNVNNTVTVTYTGSLVDGSEFDNGTNIKFGLWGVIDGWKYGMQEFSKGSSGKLIIPSELGYGENGQGTSIPGNSVLIFDIELVDFL